MPKSLSNTGRGNSITSVYLRRDRAALLIDRVLPDPEAHALQQDHATRLLPGHSTALELPDALDAALDGEDGLARARRGHGDAVVHGRQPADGPLGAPRGRVHARRVGGLDEVLADHVHDALAVRHEVAQRVLGRGEG
ncbi:hypothetical protein ONZ43_g4707 [Nemania bipapillata]|uniref:Uncharacterized protein n=1 Tax=Nemania bipapillata TaxID=110536 RepID=A0ACC2IJC7_9PEZI|nr:hypothetical protein ONZ43_g4707 [Nemania bipapillata]